MAAPTHPVVASEVEFFTIILKQVSVNLATYGIQVALYIATMAALARTKSSAWILKLAITALLAFSTIGAATHTTFYTAQMPHYSRRPPPGLEEGLLFRLDIVLNVAFNCNFLISDAIVVWRAWVLYTDRIAVKVLLLFCMVMSTAGVIAHTTWLMLTYGQSIPGVRRLIISLPLLFTNFVSTGLIWHKVWSYRRAVRALLGRQRNSTLAENIMLVLVESGFVYCGLWVLYVAINGVDTGGPHPNPAYGVILTAYHNIAAIYPTFVVLIITMQRCTTQQLIATHASVSVQFASDEAVLSSDESRSEPGSSGSRPILSTGRSTKITNTDEYYDMDVMSPDSERPKRPRESEEW
ncbi:uncharacterized protein SCHCODRAFT_02483667 [Schizophyllum commune H4-8]|nr:uncharacterized protein SCHCODRAFT_02483667 [Schizophyllum commune H4-8]KAI5899134.1 hypothetical protein SCHCODRAFT_02483667 [Schizophyllum commune H4-8]